MSIVQRISSWFQRTKFIEIPLVFDVGYENGYHLITVHYIGTNGERQQIKDIPSLWNHGFFNDNEHEKQVIAQKDYETLLAIRALNPRIDNNGVIRSEVYPSVLNYLRRNDSVKESESSEELIIHDQPLSTAVELEYTHKEGIKASAGYQIEGSDEIVLKKGLNQTQDPDYLQIGKNFYLTPVIKDDLIRDYIDSGGFSVAEADIPHFLLRDIAFLRSNFSAVLLDQIESLNVVQDEMVPQFSLDIQEKGWLEFKVDYKIGEYVLPLDLFKKTKNGFVQIDDTTWAKVDEKELEVLKAQLDELEAQVYKDGFRTDISKFQNLEELIAFVGGLRAVSEEYERFERELTDFVFDPKFMLPEEIEATLIENGFTLRDYQRSGIHWLNWLTDHYLHGVLADDMGLGKTLQTIINMRLNYEEENPETHSLIICPRSVLRHWEREIKRVWKEAKVYIYHGPYRNDDIFHTKVPKIFITTYATAANDAYILQTVPFFYLILDEGTRIKNPQAKRSKAIKTLNAAHRFVLSGTPIENRPAELWSIFDFLMKGHLGTYGGFVSDIESPIINGDKEKAEFLGKRISPFILRRLKEEVAKDLPPKVYNQYTCGLTQEQASLYGQIQGLLDPVRQDLLAGKNVSIPGSILPVITKLKQVCDHPALITNEDDPILDRSEKFDIIADKISEITESGDKVVVFSHFLKTLDLLESYVISEGLHYIRIDGSTTNRQALIDRFEKNDNVKVALCSLLAAGEGITLTSANHVIHVDRWWNPAKEDQATDRVHRIGQNKTVFVHHVLTEGTLEERILKILERKRGISDQVISAAGGFKGWTKEELLELLEPLKI